MRFFFLEKWHNFLPHWKKVPAWIRVSFLTFLTSSRFERTIKILSFCPTRRVLGLQFPDRFLSWDGTLLLPYTHLSIYLFKHQAPRRLVHLPLDCFFISCRRRAFWMCFSCSQQHLWKAVPWPHRGRLFEKNWGQNWTCSSPTEHMRTHTRQRREGRVGV